MAPGSRRTAEPDPQLHPGMADGRSGLQAVAEERGENLSAWPESSSEDNRKNQHETAAHVSEAGQGALVSASPSAAAGAGGFQGTERRTKNDRPISWPDSRPGLRRGAPRLDRSRSETGRTHSQSLD